MIFIIGSAIHTSIYRLTVFHCYFDSVCRVSCVCVCVCVSVCVSLSMSNG